MISLLFVYFGICHVVTTHRCQVYKYNCYVEALVNFALLMLFGLGVQCKTIYLMGQSYKCRVFGAQVHPRNY